MPDLSTRARRRPNWTSSRRSFDQSPMLVFYEMTRACDLVCRHCRACAQPRRDPRELDTNASKQLIGQLAQFPDPPMLILTGGDPFKRTDIYELIDHAISHGLDVSITPSATPLVTPDAIERLRDAGISRMAISIDGADAGTHDLNRGVAGSFDLSLKILQHAHRCGLGTQINTTLTPGNVDQIGEMAGLFDELKILLWSVFFLVPVGRADRSERLDAAASEAAFAELYRESCNRSYLIKTTEAPHYRRYLLQRWKQAKHQARRDAVSEPNAGHSNAGHSNAGHSNAGHSNGGHPNVGPAETGHPAKQQPPPFSRGGVNDGKGVMFIGHDGAIHPSGFLPIDCGKFPQLHVVDVYQNSPIFRQLRDSDALSGKCGDCEFRKICGGSRARAYATTGDLFAPEPDCIYQPTRQTEAI